MVQSVSYEHMQPTPVSVKKHDETNMIIEWEGGEHSIVPFTEIRYQCRCAECVDEWTRVRRIKRESVKSDVKPKLVEAVGRYAIQIQWNDGHRAGIYPFDLLYSIAKGTADQTHEVIQKQNSH